MNTIKLNKINVEEKVVTYDYEVVGEWSVYFNKNISMEIEYSLDISAVPKSVLAVSFISNILPMIWLCDATCYLNKVDKDFYDNLPLVKKGYEDMYPMFQFKGKIVADKIESNIPNQKNASATFFSGGVDAYTTLLRHIDEKPHLVTLWGADVKLDDVEGWSNVQSHIETVAKEYGLKYYIIKSNFRTVINESKLDYLVKESLDAWWHGFQHGVALIGHIAPLAHILGLKYAYIASSYPKNMKGQYTCASDPTIDNYVRYGGCRTIHDGYEWDRQDKIHFLVSKKNEGNPISLRVCWVTKGGKNCCECEKCYRTILEIISEVGNPNEYGFNWDKQALIKCKKNMIYKITLKEEFSIKQYYYPIRENLLKNQSKIQDYEKYQWFTELDYAKFNDYPMKKFRKTFFYRILLKIYRVLIKR